MQYISMYHENCEHDRCQLGYNSAKISLVWSIDNVPLHGWYIFIFSFCLHQVGDWNIISFYPHNTSKHKTVCWYFSISILEIRVD